MPSVDVVIKRQSLEFCCLVSVFVFVNWPCVSILLGTRLNEISGSLELLLLVPILRSNSVFLNCSSATLRSETTTITAGVTERDTVDTMQNHKNM